jgi:hypothetical protein
MRFLRIKLFLLSSFGQNLRFIVKISISQLIVGIFLIQKEHKKAIR